MKYLYDRPKPSYLHNSRSILFLLLFLSTAIHAQTYYVKPGASGTGASWGTAGDLETMINGAAAGSQVWVAAGTYIPNAYPTGSTGGASNRDFAFTLKTGVAIYGGFAGTETLLTQRNYTTHVTILSGDVGTVGTYTDDCYHVVIAGNTTSTAILDGFTIEYGYANGGAGQLNYSAVQFTRNFGGGIYTLASYPTINNCTFFTNTAVDGGGVYNTSTATAPVFTGCTFTSNKATSATLGDGGGAAYDYNGSTSSFVTCTFTSNTSAADGGAFIAVNGGTVSMTGCSLTSNTATGSGGAIYTSAGTTSSVTNCTFTSNKANSTTVGGGAVYNNSTNGFSAVGCSFTSNTATFYGGGIYNQSGSSQSSMTNCTFTTNKAQYGGGMAAVGGSNQNLTNCTFASNIGLTAGGGFYINSGSYTISLCTFNNNVANAITGMGGAGMCMDNNSAGNVLRCLIKGNVATGDGGGQYDNSSNVIDSNCVFQANVASNGSGGGLYINNNNPQALNCVFVDNSASANGGGIYLTNSNGLLINSTLYNNSAASGAGVYLNSGNFKLYNDIAWNNTPDGVINTGTGTVNYSDIQGTVTFPGTLNIRVNPNFYNAGSYTGPDGKWRTGDDGLELKYGLSPAADVGTNVAGRYTHYDITDTVRPIGAGVDMGAYESSALLLPGQLYSLTATANGSGANTIRWVVDAAAQPLLYTVQKSTDGQDFATLGTITASDLQTTYVFTDAQAGSGVVYYRLQLTGTDNSIKYSPDVVVRSNGSIGRLALQPSVTGGESTNLLIAGVSTRIKISLVLTDALGRLQMEKTTWAEQGDNTVLLNIAGLSRGIYYIQVNGENGFYKVIPLEKL
ncbi:MAG TPA: right-handed parallel beta-helix repeat-containing protein [Chitinophagaceae bacterium]|jgi:parallel beta-helix repeat protein/predicted outer membrane repeat protein